MEAVAALDSSTVILLTVTLLAFFIPVFVIFPPLPVEHRDALSQTHYKLGLPQESSNLAQQRSDSLRQPHPGQAPKIQSLHIYPIKSCKGVELSEVTVLPKGFELDRLYSFTQLREMRVPIPDSDQFKTVQGWEILTLRQLGYLANVVVDVWLPDPNKASRLLGPIDGGFLVVRFPWNDGGIRGLVQTIAAKLSRGFNAISEKEFMLPLEFPSTADIKERGFTYEDVKIFKNTANALNMSAEVPPELAKYLGATNPVGLFRMDPSNRRKVFRCAPKSDDVGYQPVVDFQDGVRLLIWSSILW